MSVVVVSYNTRAMTFDCVSALRDAVPAGSEIWVVDNASTDGTVAAVRTAFPHVRLIANGSNRGFGAANNRAFASAAGQYLLLLNSDAFLSPGAASAMADWLDAHPHASAAGPVLLNADGSVQPSLFLSPSARHAWRKALGIARLRDRTCGQSGEDDRLTPPDADGSQLVKEPYFLSAACLMVRRSAYTRVGGFDESFFFYSEEADWQVRMRRDGWVIGLLPAARATHLRGASGANDRFKLTLAAFAGEARYIRKHHGFVAALSNRLAVSFGCASRLSRSALRRLRARPRPEQAFGTKVDIALLLRQFRLG